MLNILKSVGAFDCGTRQAICNLFVPRNIAQGMKKKFYTCFLKKNYGGRRGVGRPQAGRACKFPVFSFFRRWPGLLILYTFKSLEKFL